MSFSAFIIKHDLPLLTQTITSAIGTPFKPTAERTLSGGCINHAVCLSNDTQAFFIKANALSFANNFAVEAQGLAELGASHTIRVPRLIAHVNSATHTYLILEYIAVGMGDRRSWQLLGEQLAALHAIKQPYFGWQQDNYIGATPQPNDQCSQWSYFFRQQRLAHQFKLCHRQGIVFTDSERVLQVVNEVLAQHQPMPSLLHGDLWSGNVAFDLQGQPFVFDPACYYGDREADLAFSEFFGGFDPAFYQAYRANTAPSPTYSQRRDIYNLYHCLNHVVLFGGSYVGQTNRLMQQILHQ